jgi:hypothetical protein
MTKDATVPAMDPLGLLHHRACANPDPPLSEN